MAIWALGQFDTADASIMPAATNGSINAPWMMLSEKAISLIIWFLKIEAVNAATATSLY